MIVRCEGVSETGLEAHRTTCAPRAPATTDAPASERPGSAAQRSGGQALSGCGQNLGPPASVEELTWRGDFFAYLRSN